MPWKVLKDCSPVTKPAATCQSLVSNFPAEGVLDHMMGTSPMAREMARTRSSIDTGISGCDSVCGYGRQTDVSLGRAHGGGSNTKDLSDSLTSETELGDDLLVGEGGEKSVGPGVDADFVAGHVLFNQNSWSLNHARADNEEGGGDVLLIKVFKQFSTNVPSQTGERRWIDGI